MLSDLQHRDAKVLKMTTCCKLCLIHVRYHRALILFTLLLIALRDGALALETQDSTEVPLGYTSLDMADLFMTCTSKLPPLHLAHI
ncbi:uncharacterized protein BJ212DRAFT_1322396 [Suillus subaureus]|uniref:Uncharacterized protein n=1 Tax=Suillus subaureus TaxID=48587 RepID=A0A9P7JIW1_9AGAM|nr:uncharacterized protein BJ212DRAFT_1322396 [Suillus subaureus]KAG1824787.1 hypothetical protein BJ212DRAFT_1322396 [Suillus subaureus]